ncbi:hypothetical protein QNM97_13525 [Gordonia sp. L191]|nr:hypothetical protein [Gordonia sp. L191]WHU50157.1 hypothetical protein QNM97_13525 [Gordonia sp. L191]
MGENTGHAPRAAADVALGERGTPWWEQTDAQRRQRWETAVDEP